MIDKNYLHRSIYDNPQLTCNILRYCDDPLGVIMSNIWQSIPKPTEEYTDDDWGSLYDKRIADIDKAMQTYIANGGPYNGEDVISLICQYNAILRQLRFARSSWITYFARNQIDNGSEASTFKFFLYLNLISAT